MKRLFLVLIGILSVCISASAQTQLSMVSMFGQEWNHYITNIGKILFEEENLNLYDKNGDLLGSTPIKQIDKIVFSEISDISSSLNEVRSSTLYVHYNATEESVVVQGLSENQVTRIYSLQGNLLQSQIAGNYDVHLYVGNLVNGIYLIQVGAQVVKFIKE